MDHEHKLNVYKLMEHLQETDLKFDMTEHPTCLIAHTAILATGRYRQDEWNSKEACSWLGLPTDEHTRMSLYLAMGNAVKLEDITKEHAIRMLDNLADTGVVDWNC